MKKTTLLLVLIMAGTYLSAQVDTTKKKILSQQQVKLKAIPASNAVLIRKDAAKLQLQIVQFRDSLVVSKVELDKILNELGRKKDAIGEMTEMESLQLQSAMDRISRMMSTLSNLMKKLNDTQNGILKNIK